MSTRERAHMLLDELSESEIEPVVEFVVSQREDPVATVFRDAPEEDEEIAAEEETAAAEGRADVEAGRVISHEDMLRKYG